MPSPLNATSERALRGSNPATPKPGLMSIPDSCRYLGDISRAKFYADILPKLDTVRVGSRNLVVVSSLDRYICEHTRSRQTAAEQKGQRDNSQK